MRIYLIGFMGSGKTTVGRLVAEHLGFPFLDLDEEIERRAGKPVRRIFEEDGEPEFRRREAEVLAETLAAPDLVIATGGGTVTIAGFAEAVRRGGFAVWLHPPFATIAGRVGSLGKEDRPLFRNEEQALALYRERLSAYRRADVTVEVGREETAAEVASRVVLLVPR